MKFCLCFGVALLSGLAATFSQPPDSATTHFQFREPHLSAYRVQTPLRARQDQAATLAAPKYDWLTAWPENASARSIEFGSRIVLQTEPGTDLRVLLEGRPLQHSRTVTPDVHILQASDAWTAAQEAQRLAQAPKVITSVPVAHRAKIWQGAYARLPNDPYFKYQWNLENRAANGAPAGADLNVRAAWPYTRGEGILLAVADDGVELTHPEFEVPAAGAPHFNFATGEPNGMPASDDAIHATAVAGLAVARGNNGIGMSGVAPAARLASWVISDSSGRRVSDEAMMDMFQYQSNRVSVQNHSWTIAFISPRGPSLIEEIAISNAVTIGRDGKGVVMVRAGGNISYEGANANDDGYTSDPRVISVAAVRSDGRVGSYGIPGACLLVAAPGGDFSDPVRTNEPTLFTTDRQGLKGYNNPFGIMFFNADFLNYAFDAFSLVGTSASSPQVAGLVALMLAANPDLTARDVQQILVLSARHFDLADPDLATNGAGLRVSHNVGFGVPDAGQAVRLAGSWINRPARTSVSLTASNAQAIPNDGLRLLISGDNVPANLAAIPASPSFDGLHPDDPTLARPLVDVGVATNQISADLTGKVALIQRGPAGDFSDKRNLFPNKVQRAADAGAALAVIYNDRNLTERAAMRELRFSPIPAVFISQNDGEALRAFVQSNSSALAQLRLFPATYMFNVTNTLLCEHVAVQIQTDHPSRGDLRITLLSPMGTRSVLQRRNTDTNNALSDWTYHSTRHFFESSAGIWTLAVSDETPQLSGSVKFVRLTVFGTPLSDTDHDGLDDNWERANFITLAAGPLGDPDGDGYNNAREQMMGTNPNAIDVAFKLDASVWNTNRVRLSWASTTNFNYGVLAATNAAAPFTLLTNLAGEFPETEWFTATTNLTNRVFRVRALAR
jgi:subtilisin family serine protease/subtilisin-like proprotein convertase family protein